MLVNVLPMFLFINYHQPLTGFNYHMCGDQIIVAVKLSHLLTASRHPARECDLNPTSANTNAKRELTFHLYK